MEKEEHDKYSLRPQDLLQYIKILFYAKTKEGDRPV